MPLDEVARRLAQELLQSEPPESLFSVREHHQRLWADILQDFRTMVQSEAVCLRHDTPGGFTKLPLERALHQFTRFDFEKSTVCVTGALEWTFEVFVSACDLEKFLTDMRGDRSNYKNQQDREKACREWLEKELPDSEPGMRDEVISKAVARFQVSKNFVQKARKDTISKLGLTNLSNAGRPQKSN